LARNEFATIAFFRYGGPLLMLHLATGDGSNGEPYGRLAILRDVKVLRDGDFPGGVPEWLKGTDCKSVG
jgi:hypothetical protein